MFLSPDEVQSPLNLAKCDNASTAGCFLYSRKCLQMQQTIREICLSEMQPPLLLPDVLSIRGKLILLCISHRFSWYPHL